MTITPAPLTVTASPETKVYGQADPALAYTATGYQFTDNAAGVFQGSLTRAAGETVDGGPYAISQGTLAANSNYTLAFTGNALTITPAALTVTASPETKVYGQADPALAYTATGYQFADDAATVLSGGLSRAAGETVGGGPYAISQGSLALINDNYTLNFTGGAPGTPGRLTITPATLTVIASHQTKVYGQSDPGLTYTAAGYQFSDSGATVLAGGLSRAAGETVDGGPYAISQGTLHSNGNYQIAFTGNNLAITPATLAVTASPVTKVYGQGDPTLAYTASGYQFTDNASSVLHGGLSRAAGESVDGGPYAISQGTLAAGDNYTIAFTGSTLAITPATLTVAADSETKVYGQSDPTLLYTATGYQFTDNALSVFHGGLSRAAGETVDGGPYAISQDTLAANDNYTIVFTGNTLSITPATLTVTANHENQGLWPERPGPGLHGQRLPVQ